MVDGKHRGTTSSTSHSGIECTYNPASGVNLQVRLMQKSSSAWKEISTTGSTLNRTPNYMRIQRDRTCVSGVYRTESRGYASGPNGEAAQWSLWSVGNQVTITCGAGGGGGGGW